MAFGYGLNADIRDAYIFIAQNFNEGDRLFLFGFSRGAYTVRAVASFLRMYGLVSRGNEPLVPYALRMMWAVHKLQRRQRNRGAPRDPRIGEYFTLARQFKQTFSRKCEPHFVGVWDTVSSVGWFTNPLSLPYTADNPNIAIGRHAVAIDERRTFFRTNLWRGAKGEHSVGPKDLKQVWFPGVHSDVGGGYPECQSGLSKIALKWMIDEAKSAGLHTDNGKVGLMLGEHGGDFVRPDPDGMLHDSLTPWWRPLEYVLKPHWDGEKVEWRANLARQRTWPPQPCVHDAAWERQGGKYANRLPPDAVRLSDFERARAAAGASGRT